MNAAHRRCSQVRASLARKQNDGDTPFFSACMNGKLDVVKVLARAGADVEAENSVRVRRHDMLHQFEELQCVPIVV